MLTEINRSVNFRLCGTNGDLGYHFVMNAHTLAALRMLSSGALCSGETIADQLGVTRATVSNALKDAEALGLDIEKVRGSGYRLLHPPVWLDAKSIANRVSTQLGRKLPVTILDAVDSTNTYMLNRAGEGAQSGSVVIAELQTGGKGRRGRRWFTGLGGAITLSLLWRFEQSVAELSGLSLAVGLAVASALRGTGAMDVGVKWPNDIVVGDRKLGGILIELQGDALGPTAAVIGIGINVKLADALRNQIDQPVVDLATIQSSVDRNDIAAAMLIQLARTLEHFSKEGFAVIEPDYRKFHVLHDVDVTVHLPDGEKVFGRVQGTASDGALLLKVGREIVRFHGGEVSVRRGAGAARA